MPADHSSNTVPWPEQTRFMLIYRSVSGEKWARLVIESLRAFGGRLSQCPVWIFLLDPASVVGSLPGIDNLEFFPLAVEDQFRHYPFFDKVQACAVAESMAEQSVRSLVWLNLDCLIVNPPVLFDLSPALDAALRPVHLKNVGSPYTEPLDEYWQAIYGTVGVDDGNRAGQTPFTVDSYVDLCRLRPYFNTHCFSFNPATGIFGAWLEHFKSMISDPVFQSGPCRDELHQIFLHQAILSALVIKLLDIERIRILPAEYNYPLNLHQQINPTRRPHVLNSLVNPVYEELARHPDALNGIEVHAPLRMWLVQHAPTE